MRKALEKSNLWLEGETGSPHAFLGQKTPLEVQIIALGTSGICSLEQAQALKPYPPSAQAKSERSSPSFERSSPQPAEPTLFHFATPKPISNLLDPVQLPEQVPTSTRDFAKSLMREDDKGIYVWYANDRSEPQQW